MASETKEDESDNHDSMFSKLGFEVTESDHDGRFRLSPLFKDIDNFIQNQASPLIRLLQTTQFGDNDIIYNESTKSLFMDDIELTRLYLHIIGVLLYLPKKIFVAQGPPN